MSDDGPRRYKNDAELTAGERLQVTQAKRAKRDVPRFETEDYKRRRAEALRDHGLEPEGADEPALEEMTPADHFERRRRRP